MGSHHRVEELGGRLCYDFIKGNNSRGRTGPLRELGSTRGKDATFFLKCGPEIAVPAPPPGDKL